MSETNGTRQEPEWVARYWKQIERVEVEVRLPGATAELSGVTRQRVAAYARAHRGFKRRLLMEMAKALLKQAERLEERKTA